MTRGADGGADRREGGWVAIHRQLRSSPLFRSLTAEQRSVFLSILLLANWKEQRAFLAGQWVTIGRGELAHSLATLAEEAGTTVKRVRTALAKLFADDSPAGGRGPFLAERWTGGAEGKGLRILRVRRYEEYQEVAQKSGTPPGTAGARQGHAAGTAGAPREQGEPGEPIEPDSQSSLPDWLPGVAAKVAEALGQPKVGVGRRAEVEPSLGRVVRLIGEEATVQALTQIAQERLGGQVSSLTAFVGWLDRIPDREWLRGAGAIPRKHQALRATVPAASHAEHAADAEDGKAPWA